MIFTLSLLLLCSFALSEREESPIWGIQVHSTKLSFSNAVISWLSEYSNYKVLRFQRPGDGTEVSVHASVREIGWEESPLVYAFNATLLGLNPFTDYSFTIGDEKGPVTRSSSFFTKENIEDQSMSTFLFSGNFLPQNVLQTYESYYGQPNRIIFFSESFENSLYSDIPLNTTRAQTSGYHVPFDFCSDSIAQSEAWMKRYPLLGDVYLTNFMPEMINLNVDPETVSALYSWFTDGPITYLVLPNLRELYTTAYGLRVLPQLFHQMESTVRDIDRNTYPWLVAVTSVPLYCNTSIAGNIACERTTSLIRDGIGRYLSLENLFARIGVDVILSSSYGIYERSIPVYKGQPDSSSKSTTSYSDPDRPVYITLPKSHMFDNLHFDLAPEKHIAAAADVTNGLGVLFASNSTHLHWKYVVPNVSIELKLNEVPVTKGTAGEYEKNIIDEFIIVRDNFKARNMTSLDNEMQFGEFTSTMMHRLEKASEDEASSTKDFDFMLLSINLRDHFGFDRTMKASRHHVAPNTHRVQTNPDAISRNLATENRKRRILSEIVRRGIEVDNLKIPDNVDLELLTEEKLHSILQGRDSANKIQKEKREAESRTMRDRFTNNQFAENAEMNERMEAMREKARRAKKMDPVTDDSDYPYLFPSGVDDGYSMLQPRNRVFDGRDLSEHDIMLLSVLSAREFANRRAILLQRIKQQEEGEDKNRDYLKETMQALQRQQRELIIANEREALLSEMKRKQMELEFLHTPPKSLEDDDDYDDDDAEE